MGLKTNQPTDFSTVSIYNQGWDRLDVVFYGKFWIFFNIDPCNDHGACIASKKIGKYPILIQARGGAGGTEGNQTQLLFGKVFNLFNI